MCKWYIFTNDIYKLLDYNVFVDFKMFVSYIQIFSTHLGVQPCTSNNERNETCFAVGN